LVSAMSALSQKVTCAPQKVVSALPPKSGRVRCTGLRLLCADSGHPSEYTCAGTRPFTAFALQSGCSRDKGCPTIVHCPGRPEKLTLRQM